LSLTGLYLYLFPGNFFSFFKKGTEEQTIVFVSFSGYMLLNKTKRQTKKNNFLLPSNIFIFSSIVWNSFFQKISLV